MLVSGMRTEKEGEAREMYVDHLRAPRAGVRCSKAYRSKKYVIDPEDNEPIVVLGSGCPIIPLEPDEIVVSKDGDVVKPTGRFFRTAETINPYHIVLDMF